MLSNLAPIQTIHKANTALTMEMEEKYMVIVIILQVQHQDIEDRHLANHVIKVIATLCSFFLGI
jgi:hypothetical protein